MARELRSELRQVGPYRLRLWYGEVAGRPAVLGVEMWGIEPVQQAWPHQWDAEVAAKQGWDKLPDAAITAEAIRLPLGRMLQADLEHSRALGRAALRLKANRKEVATYMKQLGPPKRGRPPLSDELLRLVASLYTDAVADAGRKPAMVVLFQLEKILGRDLAPSTVRRWIQIARQRNERPSPSQPKGASARRRDP